MLINNDVFVKAVCPSVSSLKYLSSNKLNLDSSSKDKRKRNSLTLFGEIIREVVRFKRVQKIDQVSLIDTHQYFIICLFYFRISKAEPYWTS